MPTVLFLVAALVLLAYHFSLVHSFSKPAVQQTANSRPNANTLIPYAYYFPHGGGFDPLYGNSTATPSAVTIVAILSSITAPNAKENQVMGSCTTVCIVLIIV